MSTFVPAAPGYCALYLKRGRGTGFARREIVAWRIADAYHPRARPVTLADGEQMSSPDAILFPDGHVEALDGVRAWPDLTTFREAMDRLAREERR